MDRKDELDELLASIDVGAFCDREGITYKEVRGSSGLQLNLKSCPFCGTSKWKVYASAETGLGNCFSGSCERRFSKWSFFKAVLGEDIPTRALIDQLKVIARELGWRPARKTPVSVELPPLSLPPSFQIPIRGKNLAYLANRGIDVDTARYFNLRYCHQGRFGKQDYARRVIIPIFDLAGNLVSFQGRDITDQAEQKYLFPKGYASTGAYLFNGQNVQNTKRVVVGEGVFDVFALKLALDREQDLRDVVPVGTFGKHLAFEQARVFVELKARGVEEVTFMWDAEPKALEDAIAAATHLKSVGLRARIALLPPGKDPNEVAPQVVQKAFYKAELISPLVGAKLRLALGNQSSVTC